MGASELERTELAAALALQMIGYRNDLGLSQEALARRLGTGQSAVARLEKGDHQPTLKTFRKLARLFGTGFVIVVTPDGRAYLDGGLLPPLDGRR